MRPPLGLGVRSLPPVDQFAFRLASEAHPHRQDFDESVISWSHPGPGLWIMHLRLPRRDVGRLQSALARPQQLHAYSDAPDAIDMALGIVRNHLFVDGNKRTAFVVGVLFLELNGHRFTATEEGATQAVLPVSHSRDGIRLGFRWRQRH